MPNYVVSSGITSSGLFLSAGSTLSVLSGGVAASTTISNGGQAFISSGGVDRGAIVSSGGLISGAGQETGKLELFSGGRLADLGVANGGVDLLYAGGVQSGVTVSKGGVLDLARLLISGGTSVSITSVLSTTVSSGATLLSGARVETYSATVFSGGGETVASGGRAVGTAVRSSGALTVSSGGEADVATISAGGGLVDYGLTSSAVVIGPSYTPASGYTSGGYEDVRRGGVAEYSSVGGTLLIESRGLGFADIVSGTEVVSSGGVSKYTTVLSAGVETILAGGLDEFSNIYSYQDVYGTVSGDAFYILNNFGVYQAIESGGKAYATVLGYAASEEVLSGGFASGTLVQSSGSLTVDNGGVVSGATLSHGGEEDVGSGGTDFGAVVNGGAQYVSSKGVASATLVRGGTEVIQSGGTGVGATVLSGGSLVVALGGVFSGGLLISGGTATISGAVAAGAKVAFIGSGGVLALDNLPAFSGQISGLANASQKIDLGGFAYSSGETRSWSEAANNTSGTLTITDGAKVATLNLLGASLTTGNFILSDDGRGGTYVVDPPVAGFVQAMATFGGGSSLAANLAPRATGVPGVLGAAPLIPNGTISAAAHP